MKMQFSLIPCILHAPHAPFKFRIVSRTETNLRNFSTSTFNPHFFSPILMSENFFTILLSIVLIPFVLKDKQVLHLFIIYSLLFKIITLELLTHLFNNSPKGIKYSAFALSFFSYAHISSYAGVSLARFIYHYVSPMWN